MLVIILAIVVILVVVQSVRLRGETTAREKFSIATRRAAWCRKSSCRRACAASRV